MHVGGQYATALRRIAALQRRKLWRMQAQIVQSVQRHKRTSVKSCTGSGKTYVAASIATDWVMQPESIVLATATRWDQVKRQFMGEVSRCAIDVRRTVCDFPLATAERLEVASDRYIDCVSPRNEEGMGGYHEGRVLGVIDEASGAKEHVHAGIEGFMSAGHARLLELGNPLNATGPFVDHHTSERSLYNCFTISAWDTPNFAPTAALAKAEGLVGIAAEKYMMQHLSSLDDDELDGWIVQPKLIRPAWVRDMITKWGSDHPMWEARVGGRFPRYSQHALIPLAWIEEAKLHPARDDGHSQVEVGIDVAGPGEDSTACAVRHGEHLLAVKAWNLHDCTDELIAWLVTTFGKRRIGVIRYDEIGIGYYFGKALAAAFPEALVIGVNVASTEDVDTERFPILRDQLYWAFRERVEDGNIKGFKGDALEAQAATIEYGHDARGRVKILPKRDLPKSPDDLEAVLLAFGGVSGRVEAYDGPAFNVERFRKSGPYRKAY